RHFDGCRLSIDARPFSQTPALDRGHAPYAALGPPGPAAHSRFAVVPDRHCDAAFSGSGNWLPRRLPVSAFCHDVDRWNLGSKARFIVEEVRADPAMGRPGLLHLADQLYAKQHSLARW